MSSEPTKPSEAFNPYWKAVTASGFVFVGTTLALLMAPIAEQRSPVNRFLQKNGDWLAAVEVGVLLICGFLAMATDQRQTREATEAKRRQQLASRDSSDVG